MTIKMAIGLVVCTLAVTGCKSAKMKHVKAKKTSVVTTGENARPQQSPRELDPTGDGPSSPTPMTPEEEAKFKQKPKVVDADNLGTLRPKPRPACLVGCGTTQEKPDVMTPAKPTAGGCGEGGWDCAKPPPVRESCQDQSLQAELEQPKLDILFMVDTSASLRGGKNDSSGGELGQLASAMSHFVNSLPENTDIRIGMLLGHGPASRLHSKLYSNKDGSAVIDFNQILENEKKKNPRANQAEWRQAAVTKITGILGARMRSVPAEKGGAQGEALLLSLYDAMTKPALLDAIKNPGSTQPGLLRKDVPLAVIMVSDEQDVCFNYAGSGYTPPLVDTAKDKDGKTIQVPDKIETAFFNSDACQRAANGQPLTPGHVYDALKSVVGEKLIMTSIVYLDNNVPQAAEDENEMGHGFLELTALASGKVANIADVKANQSDSSLGTQSFNGLLKQLGTFAAFKMRINKFDYDCISNTDPALVDPATVEVRVYDENDEQIGLFTTTCGTDKACKKSVTGPAVWKIENDSKGGRYGKAVLLPEKLKALLESRNYTRGTVRISFIQRYE